MTSDANWQLPGEPVTRRIASSSTGSQLWVGCRVEDVYGAGRKASGVISDIQAPGFDQRVRVEWTDGTADWRLPSRLLRVGSAQDNERHAEAWLAERERKLRAERSLEDGPAERAHVPPPPVVEHDRHYIQVAFDEPTVQLLSAVLSQGIAQATQIEEASGLSDAGRRSLQLTRRARAQLLYGYAQWLEGPA